MKTCSQCGVEFSSNRTSQHTCSNPVCKKSAAVARAKKWKEANPDKVRESARLGASRRYHADPEKYRAKQREWYAANPDKGRALSRRYNGAINPTGETKSGPCEICGDVRTQLHWDHNHATGEFRGWLCPDCNRGIGMFDDDPERIKAAILYLNRNAVHLD